MTDDLAPLTPPAIPVATTFDINGATGTYVAPAFGVIVRSPGFGRNLVGGFKSLKRGDITEFSGTLEEARQHAVTRMVEHAQAMGANAVVGMRFDSSDVSDDGLVEVVAYGTAVTI
jgi:uncharacterized protein YbjQ (UPF0145 family)